MNGKFIVFEGIDGSGKTTQTVLLTNKLINMGFNITTTFEPGDTEIGKLIREALFLFEIDPITESLLFAADRSEHVKKVIKPALKHGNIVISDRFFLSSIVYQSYGKGLQRDWVETINRYSIMDIVPDLTIIFDLPVDMALKRVQNANRFENVNLQERVRKGFLDEALKDLKRIKVIDASNNVKSIQKEIEKLVLPFLEEV